MGHLFTFLDDVFCILECLEILPVVEIKLSLLMIINLGPYKNKKYLGSWNYFYHFPTDNKWINTNAI